MHPTPEEITEIECRFFSRALDDRAVLLSDRVRHELSSVARWILELTPKGREQALALTKLQEAAMWANRAIAQGPISDVPPPGMQALDERTTREETA